MDYLMHGISWTFLIRCLIDLPRYEYDRDGKTGKKIKLTSDNAAEFVKLINGH